MTDVFEVFFVRCWNPYTEDNEIDCVFADTSDCREGEVAVYAHCGQHSMASVEYVRGQKTARPEEYAELKREMEDVVGYTLKVVDRPAELRFSLDKENGF